jgi:CRP-like cAMP-binding protein
VTDSLSSPLQNHLLTSLPAATQQHLFPYLELVDLPLGKVLSKPGATIDWVFFPLDSIVSLVQILEDGASSEIAVVGNDGLIGDAVIMDGATNAHWSVVISAGQAYQLAGRRFRVEVGHHREMLHLMLRYSQALLTQMAQTAVCNCHHSILQRLCRWLLLCLDKLEDNELSMTQELIADMLGVRREGVTAAARKLQKLDVIQYRRGHIKVLDRPTLEQLCCECYRVVKSEVGRLLPRLSDDISTSRGPLRTPRSIGPDSHNASNAIAIVLGYKGNRRLFDLMRNGHHPLFAESFLLHDSPSL